MNLSYNYPMVYWITSCLIVDTLDNKVDKTFKIINQAKNLGVAIKPPNINKSNLNYTPEEKSNSIYCGISCILSINATEAEEIINNKPYTSLEDFTSKVKLNITKMVNLVKSGAFDELYPNNTRIEILKKYLNTRISPQKNITLSNISMLEKYNLLSEDIIGEVAKYNYFKSLKKSGNKLVYQPTDLVEFEDSELKDGLITTTIKNKKLQPLKDWLQENKEKLIDKANKLKQGELYQQYAQGSEDSWDIYVLGNYFGEHQMNKIKHLHLASDHQPKEKLGRAYFKYYIGGAVLAKNDLKSTITLLEKDNNIIDVKFTKEEMSFLNKKKLTRRGTLLEIKGYKVSNDLFYHTRGRQRLSHDIIVYFEHENEFTKELELIPEEVSDDYGEKV